MKYFVHNGDETQGPFSEEEIRTRLTAGELRSTCQVCPEGEEEWKPIDQVFDQLEYKLPPPPKGQPKPPEDTKDQEPAEEPPVLDSVSSKLPRPLRRIYESGVTPALKYAAPVAAVGGFVSDVLQPIGPFSLYLFLLSLLVALGTGTWIWIRRMKSKVTCGPTCARICCFAAVSSVVLGITWIFFTSTNPETGFLASRVDAIENLQTSLLGVQQSVDRVETTVTKVSTDVTEIKTDVKDISKGVTSIGKMGGIITDPTTPVEFYNNALIYKERGDIASQRESLEAFVRTGEQKIEPYEMLSQVLKGMEGADGARKAYAALIKENPDNVMLRTYLFRLLPNEELVPHFREIIDANPDFTPAYYEILGRGMYEGLLINSNGKAFMNATFRLSMESFDRIPSWQGWPSDAEQMAEDEKFHEQTFHEELEKRGIDPEKIFDNDYRNSVENYSLLRRTAEKATKLREEIRRTEVELAFYREVRTPALEEFISEVEAQMEAALNKDDFAEIYSTYLEIIKDRPLREFVYNIESAYYADYPQSYYRQWVTQYQEKFGPGKKKKIEQNDEKIRRTQEELDQLKSELDSLNDGIQ